MAGVEDFVHDLVDRRLQVFRQQLDLDLVPIKLAIKAHDDQLKEIQACNTTLGQGQSRIEGKFDTFRDEQRANHVENREANEARAKETATLIALIHTHIGEHNGKNQHKDELEKEEDRTSQKRATWIRVVIGLGGSGGLVKWVHDHWHGLHLK